MFKHLSDQALEEAHKNAVGLKLDKDFIAILEREMKNRGLSCERNSARTTYFKQPLIP
ncbi:sporulation histidine kinase inhibitor Sda [Virgibacillus sp. MSP4-1]|uniref:sporulation histidine kinase inhibitor Sda n=1 Tax=Virgibacillus sp. MSP4-1 TaxID=2700081 RepID=UPI0003A75423|nr:sporulation histidine kinase inhibitor Sda [Virgibacillus sp. MSP4-1]QHS21575.1 sporulation histidine kinase inhibitor Sda [Virgibacillus sp. MSP4-1]